MTERYLNQNLEIDKKKICEWIMCLDIDDFYDLCCALSEQFEFTNEQLFYSCYQCEEEHGDVCDNHLDSCKKMFVEHYTREEK